MADSHTAAVASEIMKQIRWNRIVVMIGAKDPIAIKHEGKPALRFDFKAKAKNSIKRIYIALDEGKDLYDVYFYKKRTNRTTLETKETLVDEVEGVFFDQLIEIIEKYTGLYLYI